MQQETGVIISDVLPGGPAEAAGVKQGDIILSVDGIVMEQSREFILSALIKNDGDVLSLSILRGFERFKLNVKVVTVEDGSNFLKELLATKQNLSLNLELHYL